MTADLIDKRRIVWGVPRDYDSDLLIHVGGTPSGTSWPAISGAKTATISGRVGKSEGLLGDGLDFFGGGAGKAEVATFAELHAATEWTLDCLIRPRSSGEGAKGRILSRNEQHCIWIDSSGKIQIIVDWSTTDGAWESPAILSFNVPFRLTVTYPGAATTSDPKIYIDSVPVIVTETATPVGTLETTSGTLAIGNNTAGTLAFDGVIDEVRYFSRELLCEEVRDRHIQSARKPRLYTPRESYPETTAPIAAGSEVGPWRVGSGTHDWTDDGTKRGLVCATAGWASLQQPHAFGSWYFKFKKKADGNTLNIMFIADMEAAPTATGQDGYVLVIGSDESVSIRRFTNGASAATVMTTAASFIAFDVEYEAVVSRKLCDGEFRCWVKGGIYDSWTEIKAGAKDTTHVISGWSVVDPDADDEISDFRCYVQEVAPPELVGPTPLVDLHLPLKSVSTLDEVTTDILIPKLGLSNLKCVWGAGDGETPRIWLGNKNTTPIFTTVGTPTPGTTPYVDSDGNPVASERYGVGGISRRSALVDPLPAGHDSVTIALIRNSNTNGCWSTINGWTNDGLLLYASSSAVVTGLAYFNGVGRYCNSPLTTSWDAWGLVVYIYDWNGNSTMVLNGAPGVPTANGSLVHRQVGTPFEALGYGADAYGLCSVGFLVHATGENIADPVLADTFDLPKTLTRRFTGFEKTKGPGIPTFTRASVATSYNARVTSGVLSDETMEGATTVDWTDEGAAVLSKETTSPKSGFRCLRVTSGGSANPEASQTVLEVGKVYHLTGWARSDGTRVPLVRNGSTTIWTGFADATTTWHLGNRIDQLFTATDTKIAFGHASTAGYCDFDDLHVDPCELDIYSSGMPRAGGILGGYFERSSINYVYNNVLFSGTTVTGWVADDASVPGTVDDAAALAVAGLSRIGPRVFSYANATGGTRYIACGGTPGTTDNNSLSVYARLIVGTGSRLGFWNPTASTFTDHGAVLGSYRRTELNDKAPVANDSVFCIAVPDGETLYWTGGQREPIQWSTNARCSSLIVNTSLVAAATRAGDSLPTGLASIRDAMGEIEMDLRISYYTTSIVAYLLGGGVNLYLSTYYSLSDGTTGASCSPVHAINGRNDRFNARWGPVGMQSMVNGRAPTIPLYVYDGAHSGTPFILSSVGATGQTSYYRDVRVYSKPRYNL